MRLGVIGAKGDRTAQMRQGVRAAIAESYERIHRSNLVGMGILPLQFQPGENRTTLGLVRLKLKDTVADLTKLFHDVFSRGGPGKPKQAGLLAGAEDEIDKLFG